jgi:hypothetical protein
MPDESKFALLTDAETQVLRALANAPHPKEGLPIDWGIGVPLVQKGWAEQASRYGLFRITDYGRTALTATLISSLEFPKPPVKPKIVPIMARPRYLNER